MRIPRWLLVSLIAVSAVALLAVPTWLWVEMPRWTADRFIVAIQTGDRDSASQLLSNVAVKTSKRFEWALLYYQARPSPVVPFGWSTARITVIDRRFQDLVFGRQPLSVSDGNESQWKAISYRSNVWMEMPERQPGQPMPVADIP